MNTTEETNVEGTTEHSNTAVAIKAMAAVAFVGASVVNVVRRRRNRKTVTPISCIDVTCTEKTVTL